MLIDGVHIPLTTPFYRDGRSYLRKLEHNVGRYSLSPAAGLVALTAENEGAALSDEEVRETLQVVGAMAAREKVLVAAIARDSVGGALAIAEQAAGAGFDAVMLSAPPLWQRMVSGDDGSAELMVFFRAVADGSPLPVMLASEAALPGYQLGVEAVAELAAHLNIIGIYDADLTAGRYRALSEATAQVRREVTVTTVFAAVTRRMLVSEPAAGTATFVTAESLAGSLGGGAAVAVAPPKAALKTRTKTVGFQVMATGRAAGMVELWEQGAAGAMPRLAACAPQGCYEVYAAYKDGNPGLAREKEERLAAADALIERPGGGLGIAGIKYGCDWNGYYGGVPRLPRLPLGAEKRALVERALGSVRN
jgi:4-hydroxy-2-oxoglutarate aldolase